MLPGLVLGVPVVGDLDRRAVLGDRVAYHAGLDPVGDHLRLVGDLDDDLLVRALRVRLAVDPLASRAHRPVGIVDVDRRSRPGRALRARFPAACLPGCQIPRPRRSSLLPWPTSRGSGPSLPKPSLPSYRPHTRQPLPDSSPARVPPHHASGVSHAAHPSFLLFDRCRSQSSARGASSYPSSFVGPSISPFHRLSCT